jgi:hypothetical protein
VNLTQSINSTTVPESQSNIEEQRQIRLDILKERARSSRMSETAEHRQIRLEKQNKRNQSSRSNQTEEQRQTRLEKQRKRSQVNRAKKKLEKHAFHNIDIHQQNIEMQFSGTEEETSCDNSNISEHVIKKKKDSNYSSWPQSIPRELKETCLKNFLQQMSMSVLAEATCAVCNVRTPVQKSKKVPLSKIPNIHLLKVSDGLKDLMANTQSSLSQHLDSNGKTIPPNVQGNT